jgi:hypothetical protein
MCIDILLNLVSWYNGAFKSLRLGMFYEVRFLEEMLHMHRNFRNIFYAPIQ